MAAADAFGLGEPGGPKAVATWVVAGAVALALHGAVILYLKSAPPPHQFDNQAAIEIDMAPPPAPAGAEAPAEEASEAQAEELPEITPDEVTPPDETEVTQTETPPEDLEEIEPEQATAVEQVDTVETPPDVQSAVTLPPEQTVVAQAEQVEPKPDPKPVVKREEPKPKPVVKREKPKPVERPQERPKPDARRGEVVQQARAGSTSAAAASAARQGATSGNPGAARAAAAAYGGRVRSAVNAGKSCVTGVNGRAVVRFSVNRAGRPSGISASGPGPVASAAEAMVRRASIPPMPAEMTNSTVTYSLPISLSKC